MVNFDSTHKSMDGNVKNKNGASLAKKILATGLIISNLMAFSACAKTMPCDIESRHAHLYVDPIYKIERYIESENDYTSERGSLITGTKKVDLKFSRSEDYKVIDEEEARLLRFMDNNHLFSIEDNKEYLQEIEREQKECRQEYRYKYTDIELRSKRVWKWRHHSYHKAVEKYSWTVDKNIAENGDNSRIRLLINGRTYLDTCKDYELTGETRDIEFQYCAYKITKDENSKYFLEKSDWVSSLEDLPEGYDYISRDFYRIVDPITKEPLNYEDGRDNDFILYDKVYRQANQSNELDEMFEDYNAAEATDDDIVLWR